MLPLGVTLTIFGSATVTPKVEHLAQGIDDHAPAADEDCRGIIAEAALIV